MRSVWFAKVERQWRSRPENLDVLCLGSSRFGAALQPAVMRAAFRKRLGDGAPRRILNAAVPAGDPIAGDYWLKRLLREGARPKMVLVEVNPDVVNGHNVWFGADILRQMRRATCRPTCRRLGNRAKGSGWPAPASSRSTSTAASCGGWSRTRRNGSPTRKG